MLNMKKITVVLIALLLICGLTSFGFTQTPQATGAKKAEVSPDVVRGKITSIDTAKNGIVIKENKTGIEKTIAVDPKLISSLKIDDTVKVTLKSGSNVAESVKKITKPASSGKKQLNKKQ
jgi:hypothetical protein